MKKITITPILVFLLFPSFCFGKEAYVKALFTNLYEKPDHKSKVLKRAKKGETLIIKNQQGQWFEVSCDNGNCYAPLMTLSETPPKKKSSLLGGGTNLASSARKRASQFTSAAAARGLRQSSTNFADAKNKPDYNALSKMEKIIVSQDKAIDFIGINKQI